MFLEYFSQKSQNLFIISIKGKESDPELSDAEEKEDHLLDDEQKDMIKVYIYAVFNKIIRNDVTVISRFLPRITIF